MIKLKKTNIFVSWLDKLRDIKARAKIQIRIQRLVDGNAGDVAPVGEGVSELKIDYGPGYRVYFIKKGNKYILLLAGGIKKTQVKDIKRAKLLAKEVTMNYE